MTGGLDESTEPTPTEPTPTEPTHGDPTPKAEPTAPAARTTREERWQQARRAVGAELRSHPFWRGGVLGVVVALLVAALVPLVRDGDADDTRPLTILSGYDESVGGQRQQLVEQWNTTHPPDQQARIEVLSSSADEQHAEMVARAQSGDPVDVYNLDVTWTAEFAEAGWIRPLDEAQVPTEQFLKGPLATCRYDDDLYALPFNADVGLLYYRNDLLGRIGKAKQPPTTWDALERQVEAVEALPDVAAGPPLTAYLGQVADYEGLTVTALEMVWGERGTVVDDDGRVLPDPGDDMRAVEAGLARLRALSPADRTGLDETGVTKRFRDGGALFMRNWPVANRQLQQPAENPPPEFAVAPLPGGPGALGGQNLAVSSRTTRPRLASALVAFLTGDRSQQVLFERGGLPATRRVVYKDPLFVNDDFAKTLYTALEGARPRPAVPHYDEFSTAFRGAVADYLRDPASLTEDGLRGDLEAALDGRPPPDD